MCHGLPQRDERLGWTGDAQVFCAAASYHMHTAAFYRKYLKDMLFEQREHGGGVPYTVPDLAAAVREKAGIRSLTGKRENGGSTALVPGEMRPR